MTKTKTNLSGKYFGKLSKEDIKRVAYINSNRSGYVSMNEIVSRWRSGISKPVLDIDRNVGEIVYDAFK